MKSLKGYINTLLARGKYFFTKQEVISQLQLTPSQFKFQAYRLSKAGSIKRLVHDLFMIIPSEYHSLGSLPATWIIDSLMKYLGQDYYVGLLSAAAMYGATEQQPMNLQVITTKATKDIKLPRGAIEFHISKECPKAQTISMKVYTGFVLVSSKEQTIIDLVKFYKSAGYLNNVALVIKELAVEAKSIKLRKVAQNEKRTAVLQRIGYILQFVKATKLARSIALVLKNRKSEYILLKPDFCGKTGAKDKQWKLIINDTFELE